MHVEFRSLLTQQQQQPYPCPVCPHSHLSSFLSVLILNCPHSRPSSFLSVFIIICLHYHLSSLSSILIIVCPHYRLSSFSSVLILVCPHSCLSSFSSVLILVCPHSCLSSFLSVLILVRPHSHLSSFSSILILVCPHSHLSSFSHSHATSVNHRFWSLLPSLLHLYDPLWVISLPLSNSLAALTCHCSCSHELDDVTSDLKWKPDLPIGTNVMTSIKDEAGNEAWSGVVCSPFNQWPWH